MNKVKYLMNLYNQLCALLASEHPRADLEWKWMGWIRSQTPSAAFKALRSLQLHSLISCLQMREVDFHFISVNISQTALNSSFFMLNCFLRRKKGREKWKWKISNTWFCVIFLGAASEKLARNYTEVNVKMMAPFAIYHFHVPAKHDASTKNNLLQKQNTNNIFNKP